MSKITAPIVFEMYLALNKAERLGLEQSPYLKSHHNAQSLYPLLTYFNHLRITQENFDYRKMHKRIFAKEPFDIQQLYDLCSYLKRIITSFLVAKEIATRPILLQAIKMNAFRKKKLNKLTQKEYQRTEKLQDQTDANDASYLQDYSLIEEARYHDLTERKRVTALNLQAWNNAIDKAWLAKKLRTTCYMMAHQSVYTEEYRYPFLVEVLESTDFIEYCKLPAIRVYHHCLLMLQNPSKQDHYQAFKTDILSFRKHFHQEEQRDLFLFAINHCIRQVNQGVKTFAEEIVQLFQEGLKYDILMQDGVMSHFTYSNIVASGIKTKQYDWVATFLESYQSKLSDRYREPTYNFNKARLAYELGNYETVITALQYSDYDDLLNSLAAKTLLLKAYFETDSLKSLDAHLDSMRIFILRKKVIGYHRSNYLNIIKCTRLLVNMNQYDASSIAQVREKIEKITPLTEKEWLMAKVGK